MYNLRLAHPPVLPIRHPSALNLNVPFPLGKSSWQTSHKRSWSSSEKGSPVHSVWLQLFIKHHKYEVITWLSQSAPSSQFFSSLPFPQIVFVTCIVNAYCRSALLDHLHTVTINICWGNYFSESFFVETGRDWNAFPQDTVTIPSHEQFHHQLHLHMHHCWPIS